MWATRAAYTANRPQFYKDRTLRWLQGMLGGVKAHYDCIKAFSETDFTED
jgi:non-heme chloroperoxidase